MLKKKLLRSFGCLCFSLFSAGCSNISGLSEFNEINFIYNFPAVLICKMDESCCLSDKEKTYDQELIEIPENQKSDDSINKNDTENKLFPDDNLKKFGLDDTTKNESKVEFEQNKMKFKILSDSTASIVSFDPSVSGSVIIPDQAFFENKSYKITKIDDNSFKKCENLQLILVSDTIRDIGDNAFAGCSSLKSVVFGDNSSLETIGESAFEGSGVALFNLPKSLKSVGKNSFKDCSDLKFVSIENSLLSLGIHCFNGCSSLQTISVPCDFDKKGFQYTGINLDPESLNFKVVKYSFSKWGLITEQEVGDGRLVLNHNCSDWISVEGGSKKMRRCESCNFVEVITEPNKNAEEFDENQITI